MKKIIISEGQSICTEKETNNVSIIMVIEVNITTMGIYKYAKMCFNFFIIYENRQKRIDKFFTGH